VAGSTSAESTAGKSGGSSSGELRGAGEAQAGGAVHEHRGGWTVRHPSSPIGGGAALWLVAELVGRLVAMATVAHRSSSTSPSFLRAALIPAGFSPEGETEAPTSGLHRLPVRLWWSFQSDEPLDMSVESTRVAVYEKVLHNGTIEDVAAWIDPAELVRLWPSMQVTATVADVWQPWVDRFV